jgi:S-adenosylmethionine hydrolase
MIRSGCPLAVAILLFARPVSAQAQKPSGALVFQSDFGLAEGAIAEMKGVAFGVDRDLKMFDLTHLIRPFDIWEASIRLRQAAPYWPEGTVFVSIIDPGVGTARKPVVVRSRSGHLFVGPDNGLFTFVAERLGVDAVRLIDEQVNRLPGSERSATFHGRDIFAYTGARLAAGVIGFDQVGPLESAGVIRLEHRAASVEKGAAWGTITVPDRPYGNLWTSIPAILVDELGVRLGDTIAVRIRRRGQVAFDGRLPYVATFGAVAPGKPLAYLNSLLELAFALNQADFAGRYRLGAGPDWTVEVRRHTPSSRGFGPARP